MNTVAQSNLSIPSIAQGAAPMRAVVYRAYGEPDVLHLEELARPCPSANEVLVHVQAAGLSIGDHHVVTGKPYLIRLSPFGGLLRPRHPVPGTALAGKVDAVGVKVTAFRVGDEVFGQAKAGALAEYAVVPEGALALKPTWLSFEDASALPWAATAVQALRDAAGVKQGSQVLISGASGGVGTWAVQIAKALGARVTAECSTKNVDLVKGLGADEVVDYTQADIATGSARFDAMVDLVGNRSLRKCRGLLKPGGVYVACSGGGGDWVGPVVRIIRGLMAFAFSSQKFKAFVMTPKRADLIFLSELVKAGQAKPIIEHRCELSEVGGELMRIGTGHARGQTVVRVNSQRSQRPVAS